MMLSLEFDRLCGSIVRTHKLQQFIEMLPRLSQVLLGFLAPQDYAL